MRLLLRLDDDRARLLLVSLARRTWALLPSWKRALMGPYIVLRGLTLGMSLGEIGHMLRVSRRLGT